ncbi:Acyl carrier protein [Rhodoplanes serenus]|uniref:Acyl carrier protein n=1 Tax=Rhodoplanes serenus TaxID=200615 RepID=A0A3S4AYQ7_9BRAD|nr:phosphopantetheine-binding protein [Rhodoplanes serenus]VCU06554.1 Acyl carrier protein [Rhodoplanes serenus]VCU07379.1 Acyl carrier protein [Rhodoplanes serenus]
MCRATETIESRIRRVVADVLAESGIAIEPEALAAATKLSDLGADDLDLLHIAIGMEDALGIEMRDDLMHAGITIGELIGAVQPAVPA